MNANGTQKNAAALAGALRIVAVGNLYFLVLLVLPNLDVFLGSDLRNTIEIGLEEERNDARFVPCSLYNAHLAH
jgi:hypothetical protein